MTRNGPCDGSQPDHELRLPEVDGDETVARCPFPLDERRGRLGSIGDQFDRSGVDLANADDDSDPRAVAEGVHLDPVASLVNGPRNGNRPGGTCAIHDGNQRQSLVELLTHHQRLLSDGWRPTRWRHPMLGDMELVVPDGFWISTLPDGTISPAGPLDTFAAAVTSGRTVFRRDSNGNLTLTAPSLPADPVPAGSPGQDEGYTGSRRDV